MMKKWTAIILGLILAINLTVLCGCRIGPEILEDTDFFYCISHYGSNPDEQQFIYLNGLTETGKSKSIIVVPKEIDGIEVQFINRFTYGMMFESENLEAIYIQNRLNIMQPETFRRCPNLKKILFRDIEKWKTLATRISEYYPPDLYHYTSSYGLDEYLSEYYPEYKTAEELFFNPRARWKLANVSFMYNYEGAENAGYYWIDNFAYGTTIDYLPDHPLREGYLFGGWYKEPECNTRWDFEQDTLPELVVNEEGWEFYQETRLYAKWIQR